MSLILNNHGVAKVNSKFMTASSTNKIVLITGGASGIGFAVAALFVNNNYKTILVSRDESKLKKACSELGALSDYEICDMTQLDHIPAVVDEIKKKYGRIDVLINNAGIHLKKPFSEVNDEEFQKVILTNQTSMFTMSREVSEVMRVQGGGAIVNISSMASQYGIPYVIAYTASKSAVEGMTRAMAVELAQQGIRVNCVAPGFIKTSMSEKALENDPARKMKVLTRTPMKRLGTIEEVAQAVFFLASDAASFITGVVLPVDGGNSIGF